MLLPIVVSVTSNPTVRYTRIDLGCGVCVDKRESMVSDVHYDLILVYIVK